MTTEDDFHRALDANPDDHQTRLVFADWLQERNDPRAEGYRALGVLGRSPWISIMGHQPAWTTEENTYHGKDSYALPHDWFSLTTTSPGHTQYQDSWRHQPSRRAVEDAAALAFVQLPQERREQLLGQSSEKMSRGRRHYSRRTGRYYRA